MTLLEPEEIRARRQPFAILAIGGVRGLAGLCLAWPLASLLVSSGVGLRSEGDRALFEDGGYLLLEIARLRGADLLATTRGLSPVLCLGFTLNALCNAALLVQLNFRKRLRVAEWLSRTLPRVPSLLVFGAATTLAQLALVLVATLTAAALPESPSRPQLATLLGGSLWLVTALLLAALGGFCDLVKAALVRYQSSLGKALARAWSSAIRRPVRACLGWLPYALAFLGAALLAAQLTLVLDVSRAGAWRVAGVLVVHQVVMLLGVAARAAWYARALRLVALEARPEAE